MNRSSARRSNSTVTVRQFDPGTGWALPDARALLRQGYSVEHATKVTGWPRAMLLAGER